MKRLLEQQPSDRSEERLTELLRWVEPVTINPFHKRQVWVRLRAARPRRTAPLWAARLAGGLLLFGAGTAAAAIGLGWRAPADESSDQQRTVSEPPPSEERARTATPPVLKDEDAADTDEGSAAESQGTDRDEAGAPAPAGTSAARPVSPSRKADPGAALSESSQAERGEDPSQVVSAIRAWRSERNASKARALLGGYLRDNPRGALAEDALALLIEVAAAQKDPKATRYARSYLKAYPQGRFRTLAERVIDSDE